MRNTAMLVLALAAGGLTGCTGDAAPDEFPVPGIVVYLSHDATEAQKADIEARLHATPGVAAVAFESREEAYKNFKELNKDDPDLVQQIKPETLPESFKITMKDREAFDRTKSGSFDTDIRQLPGVSDIVFQCGSTEECKRRAEENGVLTPRR